MNSYIFHKRLSSVIGLFCIVEYLVNKLRLKPKNICFRFFKLHDFETNMRHFVHISNVIAKQKRHFPTKETDLSMQIRNRYRCIYLQTDFQSPLFFTAHCSIMSTKLTVGVRGRKHCCLIKADHVRLNCSLHLSH